MGQSQSTVNQEDHKPHEIIEIFYAALKRGELIVFEQRYDKSMIIPLRVEYIYELNGTVPVVKIYSELKRLTPVPLHEGIKLRGISAILNDDGHIIEIRVHVISE